jgi:hypothetical protein
VQVTIGPSTGTFTDVDTSNNFAQSNFDNIPIASGGRAARAHFFLYNHLNHAAVARLDWETRVPGWTITFEGIHDPKNIPMNPKQWIEVVAIATRAKDAPFPSERAPALIDVSQKLDGQTVGGLTLAVKPECPGPHCKKQHQDRVAVFLDFGANIPHGTFSNFFDPGFSLNGGLEFIVNNHFSAEGIFGYHRFPGKAGVTDLDLYQFSANGKVYLTSGGTWRPFVNAGIGGYKFSPGPTKFGGNVGAGVLYNLTNQFGLQGSYNLHTVNTPGAVTKFSTFQGGIRFVF